ncbi:hypothetical protein [Candidatus Nitrosocosmicus arcticus]|uniref:Uncharacterized protein n=1 Tax=Candidatus Nitrosocosmicus arcticus TaxID=2035267 RepID=A0A557SUS7_9ARCH|nr:hypothetical protein [Candidatus Nitrosocosmicus arcticus]TVP40357.1 conserved exported protein of unknown function [Candidatus Nitrosocosmicus arcticus]
MKYCSDLKRRLFFLITLSILTIFSNASFLNIFVNADETNPGVYFKDSKPFGVSYGEWPSKYWNWLIQFPKDVNLREQYTPEKCTIAQSGPVWFLPDNLVGDEERTCMIPSDKAILLPILNGICWEDTADAILMNDQELMECAMEGNEYGVISATVDGKEIKDPKRYRAQSPFFNITVPENPIFDNAMAGEWKAIADGFYLFLEPLPAGNHTIRTTVSVLNPVSPEYNYASTLTYHLIVKP